MTSAVQSIQLSEKDFESVAKAIGAGNLEVATSAAVGILGSLAGGPIVGGLAAGLVSTSWKVWQNRPKQRMASAEEQINTERTQQAELARLLCQVTQYALSVADAVQSNRYEQLKSTVLGAQSLQLRHADQEFNELKQQQDEIKALVTALVEDNRTASLGASSIGIVDSFCGMLALAHRRLWGLFAEFLRDVDSVYVELGLDESSGAMCFERELELRDSHVGLTLRELVEWPSEEGVAPRWVVFGDPGAGKSTLARHLTWEYATGTNLSNQEEMLAIYASLPRLAEEGGDPFDQAQQDFCRHAGQGQGQQLAPALRDLAKKPVRMAWLLDGLDEVPAKQRDVLRNALVGWAERYPNVVIIVLTRPIGFKAFGAPNWRQARVRALNVKKQNELLARWLGNNSDLALSQRVREICTTPLTLTLLACLIERKQPLPTTRRDLYHQSIDTLLRSGQRNAEGEQGVREPDFARVILAELSLCLHDAAREVCGEMELLQLLNSLRNDPNSRVAQNWQNHVWPGTSDFLREVSQRSGLFGAYDGDQQPWKFLHRQLGELLAVEALLATGESSVLRLAHTLKDKPGDVARWAEVLGFACELDKEPLALLQQLAQIDSDLALRVLPEVETIDAAAALDVLGQTDQGKWDGDFLRKLIGRWRERSIINDEAIRDWLWHQVTPERSIEQLSYFHYALEVLHGGVARESFFKQCGRWPAPELPRLVSIPAGEFLMGSPDCEPARHEDETQHPVRLGTFELSATAVTNAEYRRFDSHHVQGRLSRRVANDQFESHPAVHVNWWEARLYSIWVGGRLPTEAEWEYACRAGKHTAFSFGANITPAVVNYNGNYPYDGGAIGEFRGTTVPVATLRANPWGIHEMHGNVWEWCDDGYTPYDTAEEGDPVDINDSWSRMLRGGAWFNRAATTRSACRLRVAPGRRGYYGFRLARSQ